MPQKSLFIVIEGLDGSGKSTAGRELVKRLSQTYTTQIKLTFEPHDPSAGGLFIRQVLMKKIKNFTPRALALAFATNRLDHCNREINPWLDAPNPQILICDRYYLSSLVYQSTAEMPIAEVFALNQAARKPDIIFFFNVSNEICYQRMKNRNQAPELFESNLAQTREKYRQAIQFLRSHQQANIIEIDGNGSVEEVVHTLLEAIAEFAPDWEIDPKVIDNQAIIDFSRADYTFQDLQKELSLEAKPVDLSTWLNQKLNSLSIKQLNAIFLDYLLSQNLEIGKPITLANAEAYELTYDLPFQTPLRGAAWLMPQWIYYEEILKIIAELTEMFDFLYIFSPSNRSNFLPYYEREKIQLNESSNRLFPALKIVNETDLINDLTDYFRQKVSSKN
jgi:dTMP kinase